MKNLKLILLTITISLTISLSANANCQTGCSAKAKECRINAYVDVVYTFNEYLKSRSEFAESTLDFDRNDAVYELGVHQRRFEQLNKLFIEERDYMLEDRPFLPEFKKQYLATQNDNNSCTPEDVELSKTRYEQVKIIAGNYNTMINEYNGAINWTDRAIEEIKAILKERKALEKKP